MKSLTKRLLLLCLAVGLLTACGRKKEVIMGDWLRADSLPTQGFNLGQNGIAASIGHPETQYQKWSLHRQHLILKGKRYDNGTAVPFSDTLTITAFAPEEMVVWNREHKIRYVRP